MTPVISIVGRKNSGKTTLIERLLPLLGSRGLRVGTIKHDVHGFDIDYEGKDTWRHRQAGASVVSISGPGKTAVITFAAGEVALDYLVQAFYAEQDLVLTEGFQSLDKPKIEVFPPGAAVEPTTRVEERLATVGDGPRPGEPPHFGWLQLEQLADFLAQRAREMGRAKVGVIVGGHKVPLQGFAEAIVEATVRGLLTPLKGGSAAAREAIHVTIRAADRE